MTGTIARLVDNKYFGFIRSSGIDYFFHKDDLVGFRWPDLEELYSNKKVITVEFTSVDSGKGPRAGNVVVI